MKWLFVLYNGKIFCQTKCTDLPRAKDPGGGRNALLWGQYSMIYLCQVSDLPNWHQ